MVHNQFVIRLGQIIVLATMVGGLFLLHLFDERLGIRRHSPPQYVATYAYVFGCICVLFFVLRAERRWRKSARLDR